MILNYISHWFRGLWTTKAFSAFLASFGTLWILVEITSFFSDNLANFIKSGWFLFLIIGVILALYNTRPRLSVSERLENRDVTIEVRIGNIFRMEGDLVIGSNTTFDTKISKDLISEESIQGQFTKLYYKDVEQLDIELERKLEGIDTEELVGDRIGKRKRYPIGAVCKVDPLGRSAYFLAIAHINEYGTAYGNINFLKDSLASLWLFISERGNKGKIVIPIIGTGFTRLSETREYMIREIIKSFIAACASKVFCDHLTIAISSYDWKKNKINLEVTENYLKHLCRYTEFIPFRDTIIGTGIN